MCFDNQLHCLLKVYIRYHSINWNWENQLKSGHHLERPYSRIYARIWHAKNNNWVMYSRIIVCVLNNALMIREWLLMTRMPREFPAITRMTTVQLIANTTVYTVGNLSRNRSEPVYGPWSVSWLHLLWDSPILEIQRNIMSSVQKSAFM